MFNSGNQNGITGLFSMIGPLLMGGNPSQAVQTLLNQGRINQQQADIINGAIVNGNAQQVVQTLMNNGQMSQDQFNQASSIAQMFQNFMQK